MANRMAALMNDSGQTEPLLGSTGGATGSVSRSGSNPNFSRSPSQYQFEAGQAEAGEDTEAAMLRKRIGAKVCCDQLLVHERSKSSSMHAEIILTRRPR
jgi:hypothetical protein